MRPEQRERLVELLPQMFVAAHRQPTPNGYRKGILLWGQLKDFLDCGPSDKTPEQWLLIAEEATKEEIHVQ